MTDNSEGNQRQIILQMVPAVTNDKPSFSGDQLNRKGFAEQLTNYIDRLREGTVIAIDAPWGEGKTWFGCNWQHMLKERGHKALFLDTFAHDYVEDPFLVLSAQILNVLKKSDDPSGDLTDKAVAVAKALIPVGTTIAVNIAARWLLGAPDFSEAIRSALVAGVDASEPGLSDAIKKKLTHYQKEKASIEAFRSKLAEFCKQQDKPVVFFIDELDRCRPPFAVQTIERIKHFFEVPNLVFVLLLNRAQLEKAICGIYGAIDAPRYLGKFISLTFRFPRDTMPATLASQRTRQYVDHVLKRYGFSDNQKDLALGRHTLAITFSDGFSAIAEHFGMSLRDIEQGIALFIMAQPMGTLTSGYLALVIGLKITEPDLFEAMRNENLSQYGQVGQMLLNVVDKRAKAGRQDGDQEQNLFAHYAVWMKYCEGTIDRGTNDTHNLMRHQEHLKQENPALAREIPNTDKNSPSRLFYLKLFVYLATLIDCGMTIERPY